jgi:outer membrane protein
MQLNKPEGGNMRVRKSLMIVMAGILFLAVGNTVGFCADVAKIGTVNFQKIFDSSTTGKQVREEINQEGQRMEADLKQKGEEIKALEQLLERDAGVMSKDARDEKKWQLDRKIDDVKALKRKYDRQIQELQVRLVNQVRKDVLGIIQTYGKKEGYLLIIEDISVVYAPQTIDVTDKIIQLYNNDQSAKNQKKQ